MSPCIRCTRYNKGRFSAATKWKEESSSQTESNNHYLNRSVTSLVFLIMSSTALLLQRIHFLQQPLTLSDKKKKELFSSAHWVSADIDYFSCFLKSLILFSMFSVSATIKQPPRLMWYFIMLHFLHAVPGNISGFSVFGFRSLLPLRSWQWTIPNNTHDVRSPWLLRLKARLGCRFTV